ncbi:Protein kinase-like domain [Pseudocohnilembus persalinus]|uniref:Protein kinase-like domain n=1 Tax=Pseudocohnilembus persalinus TaxID=266149 RepID=A0A0V0R728_PSEPJ|nr:Protein kinase-like domain [Pseudocohnilembus persalinus]|eukprot:KRX10021.1 Protein kinase-like domain [Pseudocohnilembus persalinus]
MQIKKVPNKEIGGGKYIVEKNKLLGTGSFGSVYRCFLKKDPTQVFAVKIIDMKQFNQLNSQIRDKQIRELEKEILILQQVQSDYVAPLIDLTRSTNNLYLILKYCNQGDLSSYLQNQPNKRLSEQESLRFFIQIMEGYKALLKLNIIHRDLKPANILLHNGNANIADFGFGKISVINPACYQDITVKGTPYYRSPQLLIEPNSANENTYVVATNKCDIWSLGIMLFEMLNGKKPWIANTITELLYNIRNQGLTFLVDNISEQSVQLLNSMLQIEEENRISWEELYQHPFVKQLYYNFNIQKQDLFIQNQQQQQQNQIQINTQDQNNQEDENIYASQIINNKDENLQQ